MRVTRRRFLHAAAFTAVAAASGCSTRSPDSTPVVSRELAFAFDAQGNRYEIDIRRYQVRRVDVAGNLVWNVGRASDPGFLNAPTSLVVDAAGNVYIADRGNGKIEKVAASGVPIGTFGRDLRAAHDLALDSSASLIFASDGPANRIRVYDLQGRNVRVFGGFALQGAGFNYPRGVAISSQQELHVVDSGNARIQVFALDGSFKRSYGGFAVTSGSLRSPRDIAFTASGEAVVTDVVAGRLAWFDSGGNFTHHGDVRRADGSLAYPAYIAIAPSGRLYVTEV